MKLSDRKKKILQIVVDDYIESAKPVSSKSITEKHLKDISSATVRSELATLEELGYLTQRHASGGRVPSVEAYKLYVSELMDKGKLSSKEVSFIKTAFEKGSDDMEHVIKNVTKVISDLTDYTSVSMAGVNSDEKITSVKLFRFKADKALLLVATENTLINDKSIDLPEDMTNEQFERCNNMIEHTFIGKDLKQVLESGDDLVRDISEYKELFSKITEAIIDYLSERENRVYLEGQEKIVDIPTSDEKEKVKNLLSVINSKDQLAGILKRDENIDISVRIGKECGEGMPEDCSVVTATYSSEGKKLGTYGVIGPVRMDYQKVISVLEGVGKMLENMVKDR